MSYEFKTRCCLADECGNYSLTRGYYDYCLYLESSIPDDLARDWEEKTDSIMEQVMAEPSEGNYPYDGIHGLNDDGNMSKDIICTYMTHAEVKAIFR